MSGGSVPRWLRRVFAACMYATGLGLLAMLVAKTGVDVVVAAVERAELHIFAVAEFCYLFALVIKSQRWHYLLGQLHGRLPRRWTARAYFGAAFLTNVTPARSGEALAPLLLRAHCAVPLTTGLAIVASDRLMDVILLAGFALVSGVYLARRIRLSGRLTKALLVGSTVLVGLGAALALLVRRLGRRRPARSVTGAPELGARLISAVRRTLAQASRVLDSRRLAILAGLALASWFLQFCNVYLRIVAFTPIGVIDSVACQVTAMVAGLLSLVPGGIGVNTASYALTAKHLGYAWPSIVAAGTLGVFSGHLIRLILALLSAALAANRTGADRK